MKHVGVAILGLGVVGSGTYEILRDHRQMYQKTQNVDIVVENVLELRKERAIALGISEDKIASSIDTICNNPNVDIVVEVMGGITFAKDFVLKALEAGKTVVTSNKELYCKFSHELEACAKMHNAGLYYEASCVGGVPVIRALLDNLQGNKILSLMGIVNGTTNYILTKMSALGVSYQEVLKEAQNLGYAEADPTADVEGYDATYKLSILSSLSFGTKVPYTKIYREGITNINQKDISYGKQLGYVLKLLAIGKNNPEGIEVRVHPTFISSSHPLASVNDSYNAVFITGDAVEDVMLYGRGAGKLPTGSAIVGDIIYAATHEKINYSPFNNTMDADPNTNFIKNFSSAYYLRLSVKDEKGVLAKVTSIFSKYNISCEKLIQDINEDKTANLIIITHIAKEYDINQAVEEINKDEACDVEAVIRVN